MHKESPKEKPSGYRWSKAGWYCCCQIRYLRHGAVENCLKNYCTKWSASWKITIYCYNKKATTIFYKFIFLTHHWLCIIQSYQQFTLRKARLKGSVELYPYFIANSATEAVPESNSSAASVIFLLVICSLTLWSKTYRNSFCREERETLEALAIFSCVQLSEIWSVLHVKPPKYRRGRRKSMLPPVIDDTYLFLSLSSVNQEPDAKTQSR